MDSKSLVEARGVDVGQGTTEPLSIADLLILSLFSLTLRFLLLFEACALDLKSIFNCFEILSKVFLKSVLNLIKIQFTPSWIAILRLHKTSPVLTESILNLKLS